MKTNQNMTRKMGSYDVIQRTQDGYFDANYLLYHWNKQPGHIERRMDKFLELDSTKEFIHTIVKREKSQLIDNQIEDKNTLPDYQIVNAFQAVIKGKVKTLKDGTKIPSSVWMHPLLFIDFAMWINPVFKYDVLKFVYDEMIKYRHEAGDEYRAIGDAIQKIVPAHFIKTAMCKVGEALNWIVFNRHEPGIRNMFGDEQKQRELALLEKKVADLITEGFITEYKQLVNYLRQRYHEKNYPKIFAA